MRQKKNNFLRSLANGQLSLKWLFIIILLPGVLASSWLALRYFNQEQEQVEQELRRTARSLSQTIDRELAAHEAALLSLAASRALTGGDLPAFRQLAIEVMAIHGADNIILTAPDGKELINLRRPGADGASMIPDLNLDFAHLVVQKKPQAVSSLFHSALMQGPVVASSLPIFRDGRVRYLLALVRRPERIADILDEQQFPDGWFAGIYDNQHRLVAGSGNPEQFIRRTAGRETDPALFKHADGLLHLIAAEDSPVVGASIRSRLSDWTVAVGVPEKQVYSAPLQAIAAFVLSMLGMMACSLALGWFFGAYTVRSLRHLGSAVHKAMAGPFTQPLPTDGPKEVADLAEDFSQMLKAREEAESSLREREHLYRSLFNNMLNGFAYCRMLFDGDRPQDFIFLSVNPAFETQIRLRNVVGKKASEVMPGIRENDPELLDIYGRVARSGKPEFFERYVKALRQWLSVAVYSPEQGHFVAIFEVITQRREQQEKISRLLRIHAVLSGINSTIVRIHEREALLNAACQVAVEDGRFGIAWVGLLNEDGHTLHPVAARGVDVESITDNPIPTSGEIPAGQATAYEALQSKRAVYCNDITRVPYLGPVRRKALEHGYRSVCVLPLVVDGAGIGVMALYAAETDFFDAEEMRLLDELAADISFALQYIARDERLNYLACYDALTGLPNRMLFLDRLTQFMNGASRGGYSIAILILDLDRFTYVNETYGRHVGDAVLKMVAARLRHAVREPCTLARIGADRFAVAVSELEHGAEAASVVQTRIADALSEVFVLDELHLHVAVHAGVALYPGDGDSAETLFQSAEAAHKEAQSSGVRYLYYAPEINTRIAASLTLERELRRAYEEGQFIVHLQPQLDLRSGHIAGAEALIRWQHPQRGLVPPGDFIPLAEQAGLIVPIGEWVLDTICAQQAAWLEENINPVRVAVNLSPLQFGHGKLLPSLEAILARHKLAAKYIELELTESLVMRDPEEAAQTMDALRNRGFRIALDDFGTGYSSLAYLRRFPFDAVKIDRTFVNDIIRNPGDAAIATAVIAMAHRLNLEVVAEGVETEGQLHFLRQHDCDHIQGFYFSRPVPVEAFADMLRTRKAISFEHEAPVDETRTLLIVDDEPGIRAALQRTLMREGYRVLEASNGEEGLELLARHRVQVIISDQRMPSMSGFEFLSIVKELHPNTVRILLSGHTDLQLIADAINRGAVYKFLTKPLNEELLREQVRDAFLRSHPLSRKTHRI